MAVLPFKKISNFRDINNNHSLEKLDSVLKNRALHIIEENNRVLKMKDAILKNNPDDIGDLMYKSHLSLRDLYEVSCYEIDFLIESSKEIAGWYGGRIMGGGFGGNTLNLIKKGYENEYVDIISSSYKKKFDINCSSHLICFVNGAEIINISDD